jgi:Polysaccharide deacetylase
VPPGGKDPRGGELRDSRRHLGPKELSELRRWAERLGERGADSSLRAAAKAVLVLADQLDGHVPSGGLSPARLAQLRKWAQATLKQEGASERAAAARAILMLEDEIDSRSRQQDDWQPGGRPDSSELEPDVSATTGASPQLLGRRARIVRISALLGVVAVTLGALAATGALPPSHAGKAAAPPVAASLPATVEPVDSGLRPNELGVVPVLMYHQILPDGGGDYDLTPAEFRAELERLWSEDYRPISAADYVNGTIDVPKGTTPVVMTFDDSTTTQIRLQRPDWVDPTTAVGIMLDFARIHPGFKPAGTFYLNRDPFHAGDRDNDALTWLVEHGFDLGNHTFDHANLATISARDVQRELVLENRLIHASLPDFDVVTMALPYGTLPSPASLASRGSWKGERYAFKGVMLVGANPAPSPYSTSFDGTAIPRIRSSPPIEKLEYGSSYWLDELEANPDERFVSDGEPDSITVSGAEVSQVAKRYRAQVQVAAPGR